jgi:general secretion pathway protein L
MAERLLVRLHPDGALSWLSITAGAPASAAQAGTPPAQAVARAQRVIVIVPADDVLLVEAPRMSGQRSQFAKAVPFALEDQLVSPVEDMHFAFPEKLGGERVAIGVVSRTTMRAWIDRLTQAGVRADAMFAETQLLPVGDEAGTVAIEGARAAWRSAPSQAGTCDIDGLSEWLGVIRAGEPALRALDVYDFRRAAPALPIADRGLRYHRSASDLLSFLAAQTQTEPVINLLQGEFAPLHRQAPTQKLWRNAAMLCAAAVLLAFVYLIADYVKASHQADQLEDSARQVLHDTFPQMDNVAGDPRQLMQSALENLRGGADATGLLYTLTKIAPILSSTTRTTLTGLEYHNATLELGLRAPDVQTLDRMREQIATLPGLTVTLTAANSGSNGGVDGRIRIGTGKS